DLLLIERRGISREQIETQLKYFKKGFPFLEVISAATVGDGILKVDEETEDYYLQKWDDFLKSNKSVTKFVPASGAATRMFKDLFSFYNSDDNLSSTDFMKTFFKRIDEFAFYPSLNNVCIDLFSKSVDELIDDQRYKD